jgi:Protein of unknown function (DUF2442)
MTPSIINILTADLVGDYRIRITFDDASEQTIDFKRFLSDSVHPDIRAWLDPDRFSRFRVEYGELIWGDYDLCFPMIDLYRNSIDHKDSRGAAA